MSEDSNGSGTKLFLFPMIFFTLLLSVSATADTGEVAISGKTMGTTYHIKVVAGDRIDKQELASIVDQRLIRINKSMSTYDPGSEISRFNRFNQAGEPFPVSNDFYTVMQSAAQLHRKTGGAWDGTVGPLVELWGFGRSRQKAGIPSKAEITHLMKTVGFPYIGLSSGGLTKTVAKVSVDLASIAKGYGVDWISFLLKERGYRDYLVEIGGEVFASGSRPDGTPWRVGINHPERGGPPNKIYKIVNLRDRAMATSGDYRNYFVVDGKPYSHILDPRTGYPVSNRVASVSVVAANCMLADGMATAMMVMGPQESLRLAERTPDLACIILVREADDTLTEHRSKGFDQAQ